MELFSPVALDVASSPVTPRWQLSYGPGPLPGSITGKQY